MATKGFISAAFNLPGTSFPVIKDVQKYVYGKGKGDLDDKSRIGSIYHTRGIVAGIITTEGIRKAQERRRDFTVDWVHLKLNDQAQRTVLCKDPFRAYDERVQRLIDGM